MATRINYILRGFFIVMAMAFFAPAMAQNTKGDKAQDNQRTIRRTEGKSVKKKSKAVTRDIAGRRLRTRNKSSANRANVGIPQPYTTQRRPRRETDRAARVPMDRRGNVSRERRRADPDRSWQGDISGYKTRRIKPSQSDANRANVYPQGKYASRQPRPKERPFKGYENKTASGKPIVKRSPKHSERAWRGDLKGNPFYPPSSKTGKINNVFPQKTRYSKYVSKRPSPRDRSYNNRDNVAKARRMGTDTSPKRWGRGTPSGPGGQAPYVTRGRKNVYWGKTRVGGKPITRDPAGRPLSRRNFRSQGMGIVGRDTLAFFGRKPHEDAVFGKKRKGRFLPGSEAKGGWLNDIAGYRLRKHTPGGGIAAGGRAKNLRSSAGYRSNKPIQGKTPGIGASAIEHGLKKTGGGNGKNFGDQGGAFTGFIKAKRKGRYSGQARAALWNNNGSPIAPKGVPSSGIAAARFSGRLRGGKNFGDQGSGYTGDIKRKKLYGDEEYAYRGFQKGGKKQGKFIGSAHRLWNNNATPVQGRGVPASGLRAGNFSGKTRDGGKNFRDQGGTYTGDLKRKKLYADEEYAYRGFQKGGKKQGRFIGSVHALWNNQGKAVTQLETSRSAAQAGNFQGKKKTRGPEKGRFLTSPDVLWNNREKPVTELQTSRAASAAGNFQGRKKTREPEKGKIMGTPNVLWNNNEKATTQVRASKAGSAAGSYQGRLKARRPEKYPLNSKNTVWNNEGKATTQIKLTNAGARAGSFSGNTKFRKETKNRDTEIEDRMRLKRSYVENPHQVDEAIKKQKPELNYKAGNFASGAKVTGRRRHNPNSVDDALDAYHNRASARRVDYQGNVRSRKFFDRRESPDAKFVNQGENNVKEDRTIMTNMKLLWAKLFQKSESQPSNLKDKSHKMKYDKGEKGMWAD